VKDVKGKKKCFCKYTCSKRRAGKNVDPLLDGTGARLANDMEKGKGLNAFFILTFTCKIDLQDPRAPESRRKVRSKEDLPSLQ